MAKILSVIIIGVLLLPTAHGQDIAPAAHDSRMDEIISAVSAARIEKDIKKLVSFGTRHTLSDTVSNTRGIGAARRWIKSEFENISSNCNNCLEVNYHKGLVKAGESRRIPKDTWIVNVMAIKKGTLYPNNYIIMSGDIDSRISDPLDATNDSPGANDNASGMAGVLEAARVLSQYEFSHSIIFVGLSGEEQGLFGGKFLAADAQKKEWNIVGVLNNDMIGNIKGIDGVIDNSSFRIFSEPGPANMNEQQQIWNRFYGGEVDGPSRQLARYIHKVTNKYLPQLNPILIYRLDRFGRGGHHRDGIDYGDVLSGVNFDYAAKLTTVNALSLASIAWAPSAPDFVMIGGAVKPSTKLKWDPVNDEKLLGYRVYWRDTTAPTWQYEKWVGNKTEVTLKNIVIDNYLFGVSSVSKDGNESVVTYPRTLIPRR